MQRTFELSTHVKPVSRTTGRTATSAAAYRACCVIECEREARTHDFTRKRGLESTAIFLPPGAPRWARDRAKLWNEAELIERNGKRGKNAGELKANAQTAREFFFSFPVELSPAGRRKAAEAIARHLADTHRIAVDFAIHLPGKQGDERNFHCHTLTTTRRITSKGLGQKARESDDLKTGPKLTKTLRAFTAQTLNAELKAEGKAEAVFVEHRSFKARGSGQAPTRHQGVDRTNLRRNERSRARRAWTAEQQKAQKERHDKELASLKLRQDFTLQTRLASLAQRERDGEAAIRREFAGLRRADTEPTGLRRLFQIVTGREGRAAFDRLTRDAQRAAAEETRQA
ncbi:MAG: MobA/MobL family protein [Beijerinckiaceae bacterium]|nr:MobA/MobL family protein [Beijerinckiaceae bacterium]